jgi:Rieske Fe-S protein
MVAAGGAALYRDSGGFFARSLTCGHLGCRVREDDAGGFTCPCHGSRYASMGTRVEGPASGDLDCVELSVDEDGRLVLDLATSVDAAWRLSLPAAAHPYDRETTPMNRGLS